MKKYALPIICILMCLSLISCSSKVSTVSGEGSGEAELVKETVTETETEEESETESETLTETDNNSEKENEDTAEEAPAQSEATQAAQTPSGGSSNNSATPNDNKPKVSTCTLEIECKEILNHMDSLASGHEALIPSDGVVLSTATVELGDGDTAYDVLIKACKDNGIYVNEKNTVYGKYIAGINNIDEKDCGPRSGWLYSVNGVMPSKACSYYTVSPNDKIVFRYTCG